VGFSLLREIIDKGNNDKKRSDYFFNRKSK